MGEASIPLVSNGEEYVEFLGSNAVDAERLPSHRGHEQEALATFPFELEKKIPVDHQPGQPTVFRGPFGPLEVATPDSARPGLVLRHRAAPTAEYRIEVPPNTSCGVQLRFQMKDG